MSFVPPIEARLQLCRAAMKARNVVKGNVWKYRGVREWACCTLAVSSGSVQANRDTPMVCVMLHGVQCGLTRCRELPIKQ